MGIGNRRLRRAAWALAAIFVGIASSAEARVTAFDVTSEEPAYGGQIFGNVGAYERIDGIAHFAIDPHSKRAQKIVGIDKAPVDAEGDVEFSTEVTILRPIKPVKDATLLYSVVNRGRNLGFVLLNRSPLSSHAFSIANPGDGFLMKQGYTIVWSGWQTGLPDGMLQMTLPTLKGVTGRSREEFVFDDQAAKSTATLSYPAASLDPSRATLTVREDATAPRRHVPGLSFRYINPTTIEITRPNRMDAGAIYEFIYPATDAKPSGLGFVGTADLVSFLRGDTGHSAKNPLGDTIHHTIAIGISQSGRYLRDFLYQGFNADAAGKPVFDGLMPHIAGSRKTFTNALFAQPGRFSSEHQDHDYPGDQFPFTYVRTTDPLTGRTGSLLTACKASGTCPKIIQSDSSTEFWQARAWLLTTSPSGKPLKMPDNVRLFFLAGAPHFNPWGNRPKHVPPCVYATNPLSAAPTMRALLTDMNAWIRRGRTPPDSVYPSLANGTLIKRADLNLPRIDGHVPDPRVNRLRVMDRSTLPPTPGASYLVLLPKVDADGIPLGGVREPYVAAPVATYEGWSIRAKGYAPGEECGLAGSYMPFPDTKRADDSRRPLSARYADIAAYRQAVRAAAEKLVSARLMRSDDVGWVVKGIDTQPFSRLENQTAAGDKISHAN